MMFTKVNKDCSYGNIKSSGKCFCCDTSLKPDNSSWKLPWTATRTQAHSVKPDEAQPTSSGVVQEEAHTRPNIYTRVKHKVWKTFVKVIQKTPKTCRLTDSQRDFYRSGRESGLNCSIIEVRGRIRPMVSVTLNDFKPEEGLHVVNKPLNRIKTDISEKSSLWLSPTKTSEDKTKEKIRLLETKLGLDAIDINGEIRYMRREYIPKLFRPQKGRDDFFDTSVHKPIAEMYKSSEMSMKWNETYFKSDVEETILQLYHYLIARALIDFKRQVITECVWDPIFTVSKSIYKRATEYCREVNQIAVLESKGFHTSKVENECRYIKPFVVKSSDLKDQKDERKTLIPQNGCDDRSNRDVHLFCDQMKNRAYSYRRDKVAYSFQPKLKGTVIKEVNLFAPQKGRDDSNNKSVNKSTEESRKCWPRDLAILVSHFNRLQKARVQQRLHFMKIIFGDNCMTVSQVMPTSFSYNTEETIEKIKKSRNSESQVRSTEQSAHPDLATCTFQPELKCRSVIKKAIISEPKEERHDSNERIMCTMATQTD